MIFPRLILATTLAAAASAQALTPVALTQTPVATGLSSPVDITNARDGTKRLFITEQTGRVRIVKNGTLLATPFLDVSTLVKCCGEQGLLGFAIDPQYATTGRVFIYYTRPRTGDTTGSEIVVVRYVRMAPPNEDRVDPASATVILTYQHPSQGNHNGGKLFFGPDGMLYISTGDGGGGGDPFQAAQNLNDLRGKLLRIDVSGATYAIPPDNPYFNVANTRGEIWARGLRNPWRFSFDRLTGDLFIGDVGQDAREEIDYVPAGTPPPFNFGWSIKEGFQCFPASTTNCPLTPYTPPVIDYGHDGNGGFAVTGGFRYRGRSVNELYGYYVYGDYVSSRLWAVLPNGTGTWTPIVLGTASNVSAFGEDEDGELYFANLNAGTVSRFGPVDADGDGLSNVWENAYFGSTTAANPALDGDGDGMPNSAEYSERRDPLVKDNDVFNVERLFAMQQYRDFLGREGDAGGINYWSAQIAGNTLTRAQVSFSLFGSGEFQGVVMPVVRLYLAYFLRYPDYGGLQYHVNLIRGGGQLSSISEGFSLSPEFQATYGNPDNGQFVTLLYQNVLGRAPDTGGFNFHKARLDSGTPRGVVMIGFSESPEFLARSNTKAFASVLYTSMLRRTPDSAGFNATVSSLDGGTPPTTVMGGVIGTIEYHNRFLP